MDMPAEEVSELTRVFAQDARAWALSHNEFLGKIIQEQHDLPRELCLEVATAALFASYGASWFAKMHARSEPDCQAQGHPYTCVRKALLREEGDEQELLGLALFDTSYLPHVQQAYLDALRPIMEAWEQQRLEEVAGMAGKLPPGEASAGDA